MHGFVIHTPENTLLVRNYEYLKSDNPGWWQDNQHMVSSFWEFDTDKPELMKSIMESLTRISKSGLLDVREVRLFCEAVGFDLQKFTTDNATSESRMSKVAKQNWDSTPKTATGGFASETSFNPHANKSTGD